MVKLSIQTKINNFAKGSATYHIYWEVCHILKDERHLGQLQ